MTTGERGSALRLLVGIALATAVTALDNSVVVVALPSIGADLGVSTSGLEWVSASYICVFGGLLVAGGVLTDRYRRERVLLAGLAVFAVASLAAGIAGSVGALVAARAAQGIGAALVVPATLALVADLGPRDRARGAAVWGASVAVSVALGPLVGGVLTQVASWRWLFLGNVVVVALAAAATAGVRGARPASKPRPDFTGLVLATLVVVSATAVLIGLSGHDWDDPHVLVPLLVAVLAAGATPSLARRRGPGREAAVDPALFGNRLFAAGTAGQVLIGAAVGGVFFLTALFLRHTMHYSPGRAGLMFLPVAVALVAAVPISTVLAPRIGVGRTVVGGVVLVAAGLLAATRFGPGDDAVSFVPALVLVGLGAGLTTPLVDLTLSQVAPARAGGAAAVTSAAREIAAAIGIGGLGALGSVGGPGASGYHLALAVAAATLLLAAVVLGRSLAPRSNRVAVAP